MAKSAKEYFEAEVKKLVAQAREVTRKAEDENRHLTPDERSDVEGYIAKAQDFKDRLQEQEDNQNLLDAIKNAGDIGEGEPSTAPAESKTLGEAFTRSAGYKGLIARGLVGDRWTTGPVEFGQKLTDGGGLTVESITAAGGTLPLQPQVVPGILGLPEQKLSVADLFGQGAATQNTIVFLVESSVTPGALTYPYVTSSAASVTYVSTSEAGGKPAAYIDFTKASAALEKLAAFLPVSDEMIEDEPAISSYINGRLSLFVKQAEEQFLVEKLLASGVGTAGYSEIGGSNVFDSVMAGITAVRVEGGMEPDTLIMSALDYAKMVTKKDNQSGYYAGNPFAAAPSNPWGLKTVVTNAVADGTPIVGAFREGATVWRKGGVTVEASNSHNDYFRRNLTAIRAEERLCLTVFRPKAFQTLFLTS
jgi:HK97 family phage major capsid protein